MKKINHYSVEIGDGTGILGKGNLFDVKEIEVLAENEKLMVLNDRYFTVLSKESKSYIHACIDKESIRFYNGDSVYGNRVTYSLYSFTKVRASTIRRHIEAEAKNKYGFFVQGMDLSVISDKKDDDAKDGPALSQRNPATST